MACKSSNIKTTSLTKDITSQSPYSVKRSLSHCLNSIPSCGSGHISVTGWCRGPAGFCSWPTSVPQQSASLSIATLSLNDCSYMTCQLQGQLQVRKDTVFLLQLLVHVIYWISRHSYQTHIMYPVITCRSRGSRPNSMNTNI